MRPRGRPLPFEGQWGWRRLHALARERVRDTIPTMPASDGGRADAEERLAWIRAEVAVEDASVLRLGWQRRDLITGVD